MNRLDRRMFLTAAAAGVGCAAKRVTTTPPAVRPRLAPVLASTERIFQITVCARPFRAAGPRLDIERVGEKTVVHNYGHGGSGWSLSWGSSAIAVEKAMTAGEREVAVIGCGALGLTSAILLQRAGARVTIYAKERPPDVRSARATGSWTPDSRIALTNAVNADFPALWEKMCRASFHMYSSYLGLAGNPVEWRDLYLIRGGPRRPVAPQPPGEPLPFARYMDRVPDISPQFERLPDDENPFPVKETSRGTGLTFNIAAYTKQLMSEFFQAGGRMEHAEFHAPADLGRLREKVIVNATGYGARALWKDESVVPVRGQIAWLIPQAEVNYGVLYDNVMVLGRRDGIVVQGLSGEMDGYGDANETPDRKAAEAWVAAVADLFDRMKR